MTEKELAAAKLVLSSTFNMFNSRLQAFQKKVQDNSHFYSVFETVSGSEQMLEAVAGVKVYGPILDSIANGHSNPEIELEQAIAKLRRLSSFGTTHMSLIASAMQKYEVMAVSRLVEDLESTVGLLKTIKE